MSIGHPIEVLVIGAGPAGISAARHRRHAWPRRPAARRQPRARRTDLARSTVGQPEEPDDKQRKALLALRVSGARIFSAGASSTRRVSGPCARFRTAGSDLHTIDISYENLVLATGARERFLPFPGWTLPGVFGAGGLQALARGGFPVAGKRIVVAGTGPLLLPVAAHLRQMGGRVTTVAEQASRRQLARFSASLSRQPGKLLEGLQYRAASGGSRYRLGCWPVAALGTEKVEGVRLTDGERTWDEPRNLLACGFHLVPNTELASLLGCTLRDGLIEVDDVQQTSIPNVFAAGEPTGIAGLDSALLTGTMAGLAAAGKLDEARALLPRRKKFERFAAQLSTPPSPFAPSCSRSPSRIPSSAAAKMSPTARLPPTRAGVTPSCRHDAAWAPARVAYAARQHRRSSAGSPRPCGPRSHPFRFLQ